jgi:hypothetical protein
MSRMTRTLLAALLIAIVLAVVWALRRPSPRERSGMNALAERYVHLVLALGQHDPDYVDAYYGPAEWRKEAEATRLPLSDINGAAADLAAALAAAQPPESAEELEHLRSRYLTRQLQALRGRLSMLGGTRLSFDDESRVLYDAVAPERTTAEFEAVLRELETRLPGDTPLIERYDAFRSRFVIPRERLEATFAAAIAGCRERTKQHIELPNEESFSVEYVTGKSWSAYNWYQGGYRSLIQINTDLPIHVERAVHLACHEGYPGHHAYNVLLEKHLVRDRGWIEFTVYPLFSPQSLIAEGTADYGVRVAFPPDERLAFERSVIFPAAGLDPAGAEEYFAVIELVDRLAYAADEAARQYLNGALDAAGAADWLERYAMYTRPRAEQRVRFFDQYRSYVINYTLGEDLVARYLEAQSGQTAAQRWDAFARLISSPRLPSDLQP